MPKETVGKIATDLLKKEPETRDPIELSNAMLKDYEKEFFDCVQRGKREINGDFYVVVLSKKERLLPNVIRNFFLFRNSCPTPNYDQIAYKYLRDADHAEMLWCIPDKETCLMYMRHISEVPPEEQPLLKYIVAFANGTLFKIAQTLNGEIKDSIILEKPN